MCRLLTEHVGGVKTLVTKPERGQVRGRDESSLHRDQVLEGGITINKTIIIY